MGRKRTIIFPSVQQKLSEVGENIRLARLRRKWSEALVAERAGIARNTLRAIEKGDPNVTFGSCVNVLHCLGLENDLKLIGRDDVLGRKLQDAGLSTKARASRTRRIVKKSKKEQQNE